MVIIMLTATVLIQWGVHQFIKDYTIHYIQMVWWYVSDSIWYIMQCLYSKQEYVVRIQIY